MLQVRGAETAMIELVDFNDVYVAKTSTAKAGTRRGRRKSGGVSNVAAAPAPVQPAVTEEIKSEEE